MFKSALALINPYLTYIKIGAWIAVAILIGWLYAQRGYYKGEYLSAKGTISEQAGKIEEWRSSNKILIDAMHHQNEEIDLLITAKNEAEKKRVEAIKKAQPRVQARQAVINKPSKQANAVFSCDDAVAKAKSDLEGSDL